VAEEVAALHPELVQHAAHPRHLRLVVEGEIERAVGVAVAEQIRRQHPILLGERPDLVAPAAVVRRIAVQEDDRLPVGGPRLQVGEPGAVDLDVIDGARRRIAIRRDRSG
jgi:hypothetical protein